MNDTDLEKFDPTVADLTAMVQKTKDITATDLEDPKQMSVVRESRIALKNARVRIEKTGKGLREDAVKFQKAVIEKEKSLIAIIEPEEDRLSAIEEEAKLLALRKARKENMPALIGRIVEAGLTELHEAKNMTEEQMLDMDFNAFEAYFNTLVAEKNEADRLAAEKKQQEEEAVRAEERRIEDEKRAEEQRKLDEERAKIEADKKTIEDEKLRIAHEKEVKEAEERAKAETEERLKKEAEDRAALEKREAERIERQKKEDQEALEKREAYKKFLANNGVTEATKSEFKIENTDEGYTIYKKVAFMKK
jgi:hypothetical protein